MIKGNEDTSLKLYIDGDMLLYRAACLAEKEVKIGNLCYLFADTEETKAIFVDTTTKAIEDCMCKLMFNGKFTPILCFSGAHNFRKEVLPEYKLNRKDTRKPLSYWDVTEWIKQNYDCLTYDNIEADDIMGIKATEDPEHSVILSGDKDLHSIPVRVFDYLRGELYHLTPEESERMFFTQTLTGDTTDGYKGCPGIGDVGAKKLLDADCSWETVKNAYAKKGLPESYAIQQAQVARILRAGEYDFKEGVPILWKP